MEATLREQIQEMLGFYYFGEGAVRADVQVQQLDMDGLDWIEFAFEVEIEHDVEISDQELEVMKVMTTVADVVSFVESKIAAKVGSA